MDARKSVAFGLLCGLLLVAATGCPVADPLITGTAKIGTGRMTSLNVAEVQAVTEFVQSQSEVAGQLDPLTDNQAQALLYFLQDNGLNTLQDVQYLIEHPEEIVISQRVLDLITEEDALEILNHFRGADLSDFFQ